MIKKIYGMFWRGKLKNSLLAGFLILTLVPSLAAIGAGYFYTTRSITNLAFEDLRVLADAHVQLVECWFFEKARFIKHMSELEQVKTLDQEILNPVLLQAQEANPDFISLVVTDNKGITIAGTRAGPGIDLSHRTYFIMALSGYDYISEVISSVVDQRPIVVVASPIKKDDRVAGVILGVIDIERINREMGRGYEGKTGEVFLVNRDGMMVTESRFTKDLVDRGLVQKKTAMELKIETGDVMEALRGGAGFGRFTDYRGVEVVSSYRWLPYIHMAIVAKKDYSELVNEARTATKSGVMAALLGALVFLPLVVIMARKLSRPLEVLAEEANRIAGGHYGSIVEIKSNREIEALAASFNRMSRELKESYRKQIEQISLLEEQKQEISAQNENLAEANALLEMISITDQLTGAFNRRYVLHQLEEGLNKAVRQGTPLSVIMIDLDFFKNVNDTYGHQVGDEVLRELVLVLSQSIRASDTLGRYGGEEFMVIAPGSGLKEALALAERLREKVSKHTFASSLGALRQTISLGVASFDGKQRRENLLEEILARADAELYRAKDHGRNRVMPEPEEGEGQRQ